MRCRYCNQRLNLFKSLAGSGFCSKEHQELFEKSQAETAFSRLLEFVEKDAKPSRPGAKHTATSKAPPSPEVPAEPEAAESVAMTPLGGDASEPPAPGFFPEPAATPVGAGILPVRATGEIAEFGFSAQRPALPTVRIELQKIEPTRNDSEQTVVGAIEQPLVPVLHAVPRDFAAPVTFTSAPALSEPVAVERLVPETVAADLAIVGPPTPPVLACLAGPVPEIKNWQAQTALSSIRAVRPRSLDPRVPSFENDLPAEIRRASLLARDSWSVPGVNQETRLPNLARLTPIPGEIRSEIGSGSAFRPSETPALGSALPQTGTADLAASLDLSAYNRTVPPAISTIGAVIRAVLGSTRASLRHQPRPSPGRVLRASHSEAAELPPIVAKSQESAGNPAAPAANRTIPASRFAKAILPSAATAFEFTGKVESPRVLCPVQIEMQDVEASHAPALLSFTPPPRPCLMPRNTTRARRFSAATSALLAPQEFPAKGVLRYSDFAVPPEPPPVLASQLRRPDLYGSSRELVVCADRNSRPIPGGVRTGEIPPQSISAARLNPRASVLPAAQKPAAISLASSSHALQPGVDTQDCSPRPFQAGAQTQRTGRVRLASATFHPDKPVVVSEPAARQFTIEAFGSADRRTRERNSDGISPCKPSAPRPLGLVARPRPRSVPISERHPANADRFTAIALAARTAAAGKLSLSPSIEDPNHATLLPQSADPVVALASPLLPDPVLTAFSVSTAVPNARRAPIAPTPTPQRVQPASMLVLPGSLLAYGANFTWVKRAGWATIIANGPGRERDGGLESSSLISFANALRVDPSSPQPSSELRLNPQRSAILLILGGKTRVPQVVAASALPRRRGPQLPSAAAQLDDLVVADP